MTWQLAVFALLTLVLAGGIVWYERSQPTSRMVALVAALAALAVAGRLVLAPVPNVVATTDIALLTGYALGGAPGFAVGALAAPVSNLWLGQGPWTPWQMAGWGLCGLAGAALARLSGRRLSRVWLAGACALAGFAYGALLDLSVMVTYGGEQSLDRYLALSGRALPFNIAHAAGNFALAFAAGPALVRMISRFRERMEFTWHRPDALAGAGRASAVLAVAALVALAGASAPEARAETGGEARAAAGTGSQARVWLEKRQNGDGGFGASPSQGSSPSMTGWAMLGLEAAGRNPLDLRRSGNSPVDYLRSRAQGLRSAADLQRTVLALASAGVSPYDFAGRDLVAALRAHRDSNGSYSGNVNETAFSIFALRAASAPGGELQRSAGWLMRAQNRDGGWGFREGAASDADSTGAALQALAAAGAGSAARSRGVRHLRRAQLGDGGFPLAHGGASNSQSTAWAVQGAVAAGVNPASITTSGRNPLDYLAAQQAPDGHYRYSQATDQTPVWVTAQVLLAVNRRAFPLGTVPRVSEPGGLPPPPAAAPGGDGGSRPAAAAGPSGGKREQEQNKKGSAPDAAKREDERPAKEKQGGAALAAASPTAGEELLAAEEPGGGDAPTWALGGLGALAAALAGGFLLYRRRLP